MNFNTYKKWVARAYDKIVRPRVFKVGDLVLRAASHVRSGVLAPKFTAKWVDTPYIVREVHDNGYAILSHVDSDVFTSPINVKWIKKYYA